jgi:hypothetical protein
MGRPMTRRFTPLLASIMLVVFALIQLSPLGLSWCQTGDGGVHIGCSCTFCLHDAAAEATARDHDCCSPAEANCPACGHELAAAADQTRASVSAQCCDHQRMQYAPLTGVLKAPGRSCLPLTVVLAPQPSRNEYGRCQRQGLPRGKAPPGRPACAVSCGASLLQLRV